MEVPLMKIPALGCELWGGGGGKEIIVVWTMIWKEVASACRRAAWCMTTFAFP